MNTIVVILSTMNLFAGLFNLWLFRSGASSVKSRLETEIAERAVALYKSLRQEYVETNERLLARIVKLEVHEANNVRLRREVSTLTEHISILATRERGYQEALARLDKEIIVLRKDAAESRATSVSLEERLAHVEHEYQLSMAAQRAEWDEERSHFVEQQRIMLEEIQTLKHS